MPQVVPLTGHLGLQFEAPRYWASAKSRLVAEQNRVAESFGETVTPGFATLDLNAGFKFGKGFSLGGSILNVFDTAYYEHLNFSYRNSELKQGRIYEPGRNFTLYMNYNF